MNHCLWYSYCCAKAITYTISHNCSLYLNGSWLGSPTRCVISTTGTTTPVAWKNAWRWFQLSRTAILASRTCFMHWRKIPWKDVFTVCIVLRTPELDFSMAGHSAHLATPLTPRESRRPTTKYPVDFQPSLLLIVMMQRCRYYLQRFPTWWWCWEAAWWSCGMVKMHTMCILCIYTSTL